MFSLFRSRGPRPAKCAKENARDRSKHEYKMIAYRKIGVIRDGVDTTKIMTFSECSECKERENFILHGNGDFNGHVGSYGSDKATLFDEIAAWKHAGVIPEKATKVDELYKQYVAKLLASELTEGG